MLIHIGRFVGKTDVEERCCGAELRRGAQWAVEESGGREQCWRLLEDVVWVVATVFCW
jgi:hypothetical protein